MHKKVDDGMANSVVSDLARGDKTFFMLSSAKCEIQKAYKYIKNQEIQLCFWLR